jgi:2-dehydropantoate 2-reductase
MPKKRIAILGIGAVGGYFGGLLAEKYFESDTVEIIFIARERTVIAIKKNGLKISTPHSQKIVFPDLISNIPSEIGKIDLLICAVKSYDLVESLIPLKECIQPETFILPLLNGVDATEIIHSVLPNTTVWNGCVYLIARLIEPGVIVETGNIHSLHFGSESVKEQLDQYESIFINAGIDSHLSDNIQQTIWEKFIFISVVASLTSFLNKPIGAILENETHRKLIDSLLAEIKTVAVALNIQLPIDIIERTINIMKRMPYETTSSMHSDFLNNKKTEYRSLTEFVVKKGKEMNIKTPEYSKILQALQSK